MKKLFISVLCVAFAVISASAQDAQTAAAEAAKAISQAPEVAPKVEKPKYWTESLKTNVTVGQTSLTNWAAGGDNTVSLAAFIDGNANWKKDEMFWNDGSDQIWAIYGMDLWGADSGVNEIVVSRSIER